MTQTVCRGLLVACMLALCFMSAARDAHAWDDCYGGPAECICYIRGRGLALDYIDFEGYYPSGGTIAAIRLNNIESTDCAEMYDDFWAWPGFGPHWLAVNACIQYDSTHAAWETWWYWNNSFVEWDGYPNTYWYSLNAGALCCADFNVCS